MPSQLWPWHDRDGNPGPRHGQRSRARGGEHRASQRTGAAPSGRAPRDACRIRMRRDTSRRGPPDRAAQRHGRAFYGATGGDYAATARHRSTRAAPGRSRRSRPARGTGRSGPRARSSGETTLSPSQCRPGPGVRRRGCCATCPRECTAQPPWPTGEDRARTPVHRWGHLSHPRMQARKARSAAPDPPRSLLLDGRPQGGRLGQFFQDAPHLLVIEGPQALGPCHA